MNSQNFTLRLRLPPGTTADEAVELLGAADCTDSVVGTGEPGILALSYCGLVALSAIGAVARTMPDAVVLNFGPDDEAPCSSPLTRAAT